MSGSRNYARNVIPTHERFENGPLDLEAVLEDLALLLSHDLEKTASAVRMFFEIYKKETPSAKDMQKWSQTTERSWVEPNKWVRWLQPEIDLIDSNQRKNISDEIAAFSKDLELEVVPEDIETRADFLIDLNGSDCLLALKVFLRRTYSTESLQFHKKSTRTSTQLVFSNLENRTDLLPGRLVAFYVFKKLALRTKAIVTVNEKYLSVEFRKI